MVSFFDQLRESRRMPEPKNYKNWRQEIAEVIAAATDGRYQETWSLENGKTYSIRGRPHPDGATAFLIEDITAEVTLTRNFRAELEQSQSLLDKLEDGFAVFSASGVFDYARYADLGYAVELNEDNIPNMKLVMPALMTSFREITNGSLSCAPYDYGATGIAYNRKHISDDEAKEKGAMLLLDSKFKGKIGGWNDWRTRAWYGALHTGQDPNDIQDTDAMWDALREHRELLLKYWSSGAELMSLLAEEEIYVTEGWSGRIATLQQQGHDIGYIYPEKGFAWQECKMVLKGSPMEAVELLLNFLLEPEVAIAVAEGQNYPPSLDPTQVDVGDKVASLPMFDPTGKLEGMTFAVPDYWNSRQADWSKQFSRIEKGF